jgi:hypothetical protein
MGRFLAYWIASLSACCLVACGGGGGSVEEQTAPQTLPIPESNSPVPKPLPAAPSPNAPVPAYLQQVAEPEFGTRLLRIADQSTFHTGVNNLRHAYSRNQPWNADGTLVALLFTYPAPVLDATTFELIGWVHQPSAAVWSHRNPRRLFGTFAGTNQLVSADALEDGSYEVLHVFDEYTEIIFGGGEGNLSNDDRYIAVFGLREGRTELVVFDLSERTMVARRDFGAASVCDCSDPVSINNATMSQSGTYVVVQYNERGFGRFKGVEVFDRDLQFLYQLTPGSEHGDVGLTAEGEDVWVAWHDTSLYDSLQSASAYAWRLRDRESIAVVPTGTPGGHISCRNTRRPGYCYASQNRSGGAVGNDLLYSFPLDGSMQMEVYASQHATGSTYARQPHGVPSQDGTRVLWASDWDDSTAPVYAYVAGRF